MDADHIDQLIAIRCIEENDPNAEILSAHERELATRHGLRAIGEKSLSFPDKKLSSQHWQFLSARAQALYPKAKALFQLAPIVSRFHHFTFGLILCGAAFVIGFLSFNLGLSKSFDLLAGPFIAILLWNFCIYLIIVISFFKRPSVKPSLIGGIAHFFTRLSDRRPTSLTNSVQSSYRSAITAWQVKCLKPLFTANFHFASACLTLGLLASIYFHGMSKHYLISWESTWFAADTIRSIITALLSPASWISGIPLPADLAAWENIDRSHNPAGVSAKNWIHLYAITLFLCVVIPRVLLALFQFISFKKQRHNPPDWSYDEHYLRRIFNLSQNSHDFAVAILRFDFKQPDLLASGKSRDDFERLTREIWGQGARNQWLPLGAYGVEDSIWQNEWQGLEKSSAIILCFDAQSTPENEVHGRLIQHILSLNTCLANGLIICLECSNLLPARLVTRAKIWDELSRTHASTPILLLEHGKPKEPNADLKHFIHRTL